MFSNPITTTHLGVQGMDPVKAVPQQVSKGDSERGAGVQHWGAEGDDGGGVLVAHEAAACVFALLGEGKYG